MRDGKLRSNMGFAVGWFCFGWKINERAGGGSPFFFFFFPFFRDPKDCQRR